jgi:group I intron endonuclease
MNRVKGGMRHRLVPKIPGIYIIHNVANGKRYVGASTRVFQRMQEHFICIMNEDYKYSRLLQGDLEAYGPNRFEIYLQEYCSIKELNEREQHYIDKFNSIETGYNKQNSSPQNFMKFKEV